MTKEAAPRTTCVTPRRHSESRHANIEHPGQNKGVAAFLARNEGLLGLWWPWFSRWRRRPAQVAR